MSLYAPPQAARKATVSYTDHCETATDGLSATFTGKSIGSARPNRKVVFAPTSAAGGATRTVASVVMHVPNQASDPTGTPMTYIHRAQDAGTVAEMWQANGVASGTTADFVVTWQTDTPDRQGGLVFAVYGGSAAEHDTGNSAASPPSDTVAVPANGVLLAVAVSDTGTAFAWTNLTERYDAELAEGTFQSAASDAFAAAQSVAVTATVTGGTGVDALVLASFGPG